MAISLLIVDDHPVVRDGLATMLGTQADFEVVGSAASDPEAVRLALRHRPNVALVDLELPPTSGIDAIRNLLACSPATRILVFTAYKNDERVFGAMEAGAHGYLLKGTPRNQIFDAIRAVRAGQTVFDHEVAQVVARRNRKAATEVLTARQRDVVQLLVRGLSNKDMAEALHISERTVKYHLGAVFDRLGATNRTEAVVAAIERGLVKGR